MSSERYKKAKGLMMAEGKDMSEEVKVEEEGYLGEIRGNSHLFSY